MSDQGLAGVLAAEDGAAAGAAAVATDGGAIVDGGDANLGGADGAAAAAAAAGGGGDPWYATLSDEATEGALSDRKWAENKKYADIPTLVRSARDLEKQFLSGDKLIVPKEGATPEELDAFHSKLGRPAAPDGYDIKAPEGMQLDEGLVSKFRETAFKVGLPASAAAPLVEMFNAHVAEVQEQQDALRTAAAKEGVSAIQKEWGAAAPQNMAAARQAMNMLELTGDDINAIADALPEKDGKNGTARALDLFRKLGAGMGEDVLGGGNGPRKFGMTGAEAQAKLDQIAADPEMVKKLEAKDPTLTAQRARWIEIVAAAEDAENKR